MYQIANISDKKQCLVHDDRIDALSALCNILSEHIHTTHEYLSDYQGYEQYLDYNDYINYNNLCSIVR